jgi:integrin beta 3
MSPDEAAAAVVATVRAMLAPLETRVAVLEAAGRPLETLAADLAGVRERLAAVEVKPLLAGPAGADGKDGAPGLDGKDGADGLGFDDLAIEQRGDRGLVVVAKRADLTRELGAIAFPVPVYRGVYAPSFRYTPGDLVTWGGSLWHCDQATSARPETADGAAAWTLAVKRGRDGRDRREP